MPRSSPDESRPIRRDLQKLLGVAIVCVLFIAFAGPVSHFFGNFMADRVRDAASDLPGPPTAPDTTSTELTSTTVVLVDAPPTFNFDCPVAGQGWRATMVSTQYAQDTVGYHTWLRVTGAGPWVGAGVFRSGVDGPAPVLGIASGVQVELRYDRDPTIDPELSDGYASFTTGPDC